MKTILMNSISGRSTKSKECYLNMYVHSLNEAAKMLHEAEILLKNKAFQRAYFIAFSALEEISKSQLAADVYTGFIQEDEFKKIYKSHEAKINRVKWIQIDANIYPCFRWDNIHVDNFDFKRKLKAMYVDIDFGNKKISSPSESVSAEDAIKIIKAVRVGLYQIHYIVDELGEQIGTKGFMK